MRKVLEEINQLHNQINLLKNPIVRSNLTLIEKVLKEGFIMEENTYSSIYSSVENNISLPLKERDPMFKDVEGWKPALMEYIDLLEEKKKFYKKVREKMEELK